VLTYGFFFIFIIIKLLMQGSKGDTNFLNKEPILDRVNNGETFFTRENFLITLGTFVVINVYAVGVFVLIVITFEWRRYSPILPMLVATEIVLALLFAFSNPWLQYGAQIFFFEVLCILGGFAGFWASIAVVIAGLICLCFKIVFLLVFKGFKPFIWVGKICLYPLKLLMPTLFSS
jgi:hypothetical protein